MKHDDSLFMLNCECSCGIVAFRYYNNIDETTGKKGYVGEEEICMGIEYFSGFNDNSIFSWYNLKERFSAAWEILTGKHYWIYDIILNKKDFEEFRKWLNSK
jgi:hypothetical protein